MVLGWDLEKGRERLLVPIDCQSDLLCNMLVNEQDCYILAFREFLKGCLDGRYLGLGINDENVLLLMLVDVADAGEQKTCD